MEKSLQMYCAEPQEKPFDLKTVPLAAQPITVIEEKRHGKIFLLFCFLATILSWTGKEFAAVAPEIVQKKDEKPKVTLLEVYAEQLRSIPEFAKLGALFKSSEPVQLTESETEYVVNCVKHVFPEHVVFQVKIRLGCFFWEKILIVYSLVWLSKHFERSNFGERFCRLGTSWRPVADRVLPANS